MFDPDRFTVDCRAARAADRLSKTICEVVKRAVSDPTGLLKSLGEPNRAGIKEIYRSSDLSILSVVWAPRMMIMPHNHHMWAVIGVYCGREDNIFWRRIAEAGESQLEAAAARSLAAKDVQPLGDDIIHSVTNPTSKFTAALHVYGGDFFAAPRSEWDVDTLSEHPSDGNRARQLFEEANRRYAEGFT
jgi:predicted metal-dependent enzyme (double-stranded beta helix superfamily)